MSSSRYICGVGPQSSHTSTGYMTMVQSRYNDILHPVWGTSYRVRNRNAQKKLMSADSYEQFINSEDGILFKSAQ